MRARWLLAMLLVLAGALHDRAQAQPADVASELELRAAHCVGVLREAVAGLEQLPGADPSTAVNAWSEEARRMQGFLFVQGYGRVGLRARQAHVALLLAGKRGRADQKSCTARIAVCVRTCASDIACTDRCRDQDRACVAVAACHRLNLPI